MYSEKITWHGGMNSDDDPRLFQPGDYLYALNGAIDYQAENQSGDFVRMRGNVLINYPLPAGTNRCIGSYKFTNTTDGETLLYFIYNSNGNHTILRYYPNIGTSGEIQLIAQSSFFNFQEYKYISGVGVVGDVCSWVDGFNTPKRINISKANNTNKHREYDMYFPEIYNGQRSIQIEIFLDLVSQGTVNYVYTGTDLNEFCRTLAQIAFPSMTVTSCGNFLELVGNSVGEYTFTVTIVDGVVPNTLTTTAHVQPTNFYAGYSRVIVDDIAFPPICNPTSSYGYDDTRTINTIEQKTFQFAARYIYDDGEKSKCSPLSKVPVDGTDCSGMSLNNYIDINFTAPELSDTVSLCRIVGVELFFRDSQTGLYNSIKQIDRADFVFGQTYRFYNDEVYSVLSATESSYLFDSVPIVSSALEFANDESNFRKFYGNNIEGYNTPCPDVGVTLSFNPFEGIGGNTGRVRFIMRIINPFASNNFITSQPIGWYQDEAGSNPGYFFGGLGGTTHANNVGTSYGQWLPEGGFIAYSAGTPFLAVSTQNNTGISWNGAPLAPNTTTNVYDMSSTSFRNQVRDGINSGDVYQFIDLELPPGHHIIRFASHKCSFGDKLGLGDAYDLDDPNLKWQKTSTNVAWMDGTPGLTEAHVFIPPTGGNVNLGEAKIFDFVEPGVTSASFIVNGYLYDNEGYGDHAGPQPDVDLRDTVSMERQVVYFRLYNNFLVIPFTLLGPVITALGAQTVTGLTDGYSFTDHNGYFCFATTSATSLGYRVRMSATGVTGNPAVSAAFPATFPTPTQITANGASVIRTPDDNYYEGLLSGTLVASANPWVVPTLEEHPVILYCTDTNVSETIKTKVEGYVYNGVTGAGIADVNVILSKGKWAKTDSQGNYSFYAYGDAVWDLPPLGTGNVIHDSREGTLYYNYTGVCSIDIPDSYNAVVNNARPITIPQYEQNQEYSELIPFPVADTFANALSNGVTKTLKRGSKQSWMLVYYDAKNESTTGGRFVDFYIPDYTEDVSVLYPYLSPATYEHGRPVLTFNIYNEVPVPAHGRFTHYQLLISLDRVQQTYLQWVANQVRYVKEYDSTNNQPVVVTYESSEANEIYISIANIQYYKDFNSNSLVGTQWGDTGYTFTPGDRLKIIADKNGVFYDGVENLDVPIKGLRGSDVIIEATNSMMKLEQGFMFQIYTPGKGEGKIFYEIGECYEINDPCGANPTHSQTTIVVEGVDTYYFNRLIPCKVTGQPTKLIKRRFEDASVSDFYPSTHADYGRPNVDEESEQLHKTTSFRWSETYIQKSDAQGRTNPVNGLETFNGLNEASTSTSYGAITRLVAVDNTMLILTEFRALTAPIGKAIIQTQDGSQVLTKTNGVVGTINELRGQFGCMDADSVRVYNGRVWYWNQFLGIMCQYDNNGVNNISGRDITTGHDAKYQKFFDNIKRYTDLMSSDERRIHAWIDQYAKRYYITFEPVVIAQPVATTGNIATERHEVNRTVFEGFTIAYDFTKGRWIFHGSFKPEQGSAIGQYFATMKDGELWIHGKGLTAGEFYGTKYPSQISLVANGEHSDFEKTFEATEQQGTDLWYGSRVWNTRNQESLLPAEGFKQINDNYHSSMYRDMNSPGVSNPIVNGGKMRSHSLFVTFENNSDNPEILRAVYIKSNKSERTVK